MWAIVLTVYTLLPHCGLLLLISKVPDDGRKGHHYYEEEFNRVMRLNSSWGLFLRVPSLRHHLNIDRPLANPMCKFFAPPAAVPLFCGGSEPDSLRLFGSLPPRNSCEPLRGEDSEKVAHRVS